MHIKPNYETLRKETKFSWYVSGSYSSLLELTGIPIKEFNLNPAAGIELYRKGRPLHKEMFGEEVTLPAVSTPPISYGHVNGLGSKLTFPEGGEVTHEHIYSSLEEGIKELKNPVAFATVGMAPFYIEYRKKLKEAFPDEYVGFSYGLEGPITTAYELRGDGFFYDIMDKKGLVKQFLRLEVDSIIEFHRFRCKLDNLPEINPDGGGMCDDISSMVPPRLFPEIVLPYWNQFYEGETTGKRSAHIEDLRPDQLKYLEDIRLFHYDPSISPKINPKIISERCRVPFAWRLGSFHYKNMSLQDIKDFIFKAVVDGASSVFTITAWGMCNEKTVEKVRVSIETAKKTEKMLNEGATRKQIGQLVSKEGKEKFWDHWPE